MILRFIGAHLLWICCVVIAIKMVARNLNRLDRDLGGYKSGPGAPRSASTKKPA